MRARTHALEPSCSYRVVSIFTITNKICHTYVGMRQAAHQTAFTSPCHSGMAPTVPLRDGADRASPARLGPSSLLRAALTVRQLMARSRRVGVLVVASPVDVGGGEGRARGWWRQQGWRGCPYMDSWTRTQCRWPTVYGKSQGHVHTIHGYLKSSSSRLDF